MGNHSADKINWSCMNYSLLFKQRKIHWGNAHLHTMYTSILFYFNDAFILTPKCSESFKPHFKITL